MCVLMFCAFSPCTMGSDCKAKKMQSLCDTGRMYHPYGSMDIYICIHYHSTNEEQRITAMDHMGENSVEFVHISIISLLNSIEFVNISLHF